MAEPDFDKAWMLQQATTVILASVDGDADAATRAVCDVGDRYGWQGGYALCCALAESIAQMADLNLDRDGDFYGFEVFDQRTGRILDPGQADDGRHAVVAMRFVVAHVNGDAPQKLALFDAPETPEQAMELPLGLMTLVAAYGRAKLAEGGGSDG